MPDQEPTPPPRSSRIAEGIDAGSGLARTISGMTGDGATRIAAFVLTFTLCAFAGYQLWTTTQTSRDTLGSVLRYTEGESQRAREFFSTEQEKARGSAAIEREKDRQHEIQRDQSVRDEMGKIRETMGMWLAEIKEWRGMFRQKGALVAPDVCEAPMPRAKESTSVAGRPGRPHAE